MRLTRTLIALILFGVAFAYVEAAVVVYLRAHYDPIRRAAYPEWPDGDLFPMLQMEDLQRAGPQYEQMLMTELGRELATMFVLAAMGLAVAGNFRQWLAGFLIAFGVWDIFFYAFLKLLIGWPDSLLTWDILFLLGAPWVGPVISPIVVAVSMVVAGVAILWREARGRPIGFAWFHWVTIFAGASILIAAFCWDWRNTTTGGWPNPFNWPLFALGEAVGLAGFAHACFVKKVSEGRRSVGR